MGNLVSRAAWADAKCNPDFVCIQTCSGYRLTTTDPEGKQHFLSAGQSDEELGLAVLDSLAHSRFVSPQEQPEQDMALFDPEAVQSRYLNWVKRLMKTYGYNSDRALFKDMRGCDIECRDGLITIRPTHHEELEAWSGDGIEEADYVTISSDSPPAQVGKALKLAFSRCT